MFYVTRICSILPLFLQHLSTVRCPQSLPSFPFASLLDEIDHVLFLPKMLDYLRLGNLHFGVKGNMFHLLISFPGSPRNPACRTIFIFITYYCFYFIYYLLPIFITYYLDEALLSPVYQLICILTNTNSLYTFW